MKIATIEAGIVSVPLQETFATAHGALQNQRSVLVRVYGDGKLSGWGCVDPVPGYSTMTPEEVVQAVEENLAPALVGVDPLNILAALHLMDTCLRDGYEAKAALEMALIDPKGKALGVSAGSLLGGRLRREVWLNAWIGLVSPEQAAAEAVQWQQQGFRSAKIKVGVEFQDDVDRVAAVRAAVGPQMQLRVDANEALTVPQAIRLARAGGSVPASLYTPRRTRLRQDGFPRLLRGATHRFRRLGTRVHGAALQSGAGVECDRKAKDQGGTPGIPAGFWPLWEWGDDGFQRTIPFHRDKESASLREYVRGQRRYGHVKDDDLPLIEKYVVELNDLVDRMAKAFGPD